MKKGSELDLEISGVAFGARGLARVDGLTVFVNQTVPQDVARVRIVRKKKQYAEGVLLELLKASPLRVQAPCPYSGYCGGCQWQFLAYPHQLAFKQQHVAEALQHIGGLMDIPVHATLPSPLTFGYRNKMEFSCTDRRWLLPHEMGQSLDTGFALGLHVPGTFNKILDTEACLLQPDTGNRILGDIRRYMQHSGWPPYNLRSHAGFWRFVVLRHSVAADQWMVNLVTAFHADCDLRPLAAQLTRSHPRIVSVVHNITDKKAGVAVGETEVTLAGADVIAERIGNYTFEISANSFFQTNTRSATRLYDVAARYAALDGSEHVLDLYSGTGSIAIYLAARAQTVTGLEITAAAVADARKNCARNHISNCRFIEGDVRERLPQIDVKPDVVIIDPPRVGMHKDVVAQVLALSPRRLVYVSCNPATLARDLAMLAGAYDISEVQPVDLFPHTFHIEAVARLERKSG